MPKYLKPQRLALILGLLIMLKFTEAKTLTTLLKIAPRGRSSLIPIPPVGTATLTALVPSPLRRVPVPTVPAPLVTRSLILVPVLPISRFTVGCLLGERSFTRPKTVASLFPPLRHPICSLLTLVVAVVVLTVAPVVPPTVLSRVPTKPS